MPPTGATPTEATPTEAAPTEAAPTEAAPTEAAPTEAAPTEAAPTEAAPTEAAPTEAAPTEAAPTEAAPTGAAPTGAPAEPVPGLKEETLPEATKEATAPEGGQAPAAPAKELPAPQPTVDWSKVTNPVPADADSVERGRKVYMGQGLCAVCHGEKGDGFGPVRDQFAPPPNAFLDPKWQASFSDGQLMGVLHDGKFGTGMMAEVPDFITEAQGWDVINYLRSFSGKTTQKYERAKAAAAEAEAERQKKIQGVTP